MDTDMGKSQETEYYLANKLKKKFKKSDFQGIHDRFLRDQEFRIRMIEHRDAEVCRRWDALADQDHTHHLTPQEYFHYKKNGGFVQMSKVLIPCHWDIVLSSSKRCLLCNDYNKQEKNHTCLLILPSPNNGRHAVHLLHGGIGKTPGGLLTIQKVKEEGEPSFWKNGGDPLFIVFWRKPQKMAFKNSFVCDSLL